MSSCNAWCKYRFYSRADDLTCQTSNWPHLIRFVLHSWPVQVLLLLCSIVLLIELWPEPPQEEKKKLMRAGVVGEGGRRRMGETGWARRWREKPKQREREMLLDRLLLIRRCLAPYHYVRRNPFSFAQICLEFFLFSPASIIRAGNRISPWLFYDLLANIFPMRTAPVAWICLGLLFTSAHQQCKQQQQRHYEIIAPWLSRNALPGFDLFVPLINTFSMSVMERGHHES